MENAMRAADFWEQAVEPDDYLASMEQRREQFARRVEETETTGAEREAFGGRPLRILAITEDWCTDSAQFLPPLARLSRELPNVSLRFLRRDENRELAGRYPRKGGYAAIPVILLLAADGSELGHLSERPGRVYDALAAETRRFARANPQLENVNRTYDKMSPETRALVRANSEAFRDANQARFTRWLFEDLGEMLAEGAHPHNI
jgi:hypothetical protein